MPKKKPPTDDIPLFSKDDLELIEATEAFVSEAPGPMAKKIAKASGKWPGTAPDAPESDVLPQGDALVYVGGLAKPTATILLAGWVAERDRVVKQALAVHCVDTGTADIAGMRLKELTSARRKIDDARKITTEPYRATTAQINAAVERLIEPVLDAEAHLKSELQSWQLLQRDREDESRKKLVELQTSMGSKVAKMRKDGKSEEEIKVYLAEHYAAIEPVAPSKPTGTATTERPCYEITNEPSVSRDLCSPDPTKIRASVDNLWRECRYDREKFEARAAGYYGGIRVWIELQVKAH